MLPAEPAAAKCRNCGRPIIWARTRKGHPIPLDADVAHNGQVVLLRDGRSCHPLLPHEQVAADAQERRHYDHRTTCPGWPNLRTAGASLLRPQPSTWHTERKERIRALKLQLEPGR